MEEHWDFFFFKVGGELGFRCGGGREGVTCGVVHFTAVVKKLGFLDGNVGKFEKTCSVLST